MDKFLYNYFGFNENHIKNQSAIYLVVSVMTKMIEANTCK